MTSEKKIPRTLNECCQRDPVSNELWELSYQVEKIGSIILVIMVIGGIALAFIRQKFMTDVDSNLIGGLFWGTLLTWGINSLAEYWLYNLISWLIAGLAQIVYNTHVTANVSLYNAQNEILDNIER